MTRFYMIDEHQIAALVRLQKRLHTERRMDGDEMRDAGHTIESIVRVVKELEIPDEAK